MTLLVLASGSDIARWAGTRAAQERLPELIRRLVYATAEAPAHVDIPSGDAVQLGGYDGVVEVNEDHATIPKGLSVWEMGTDAKVKEKADADYAKRTAMPPPTARGSVIPSETTFVFATPRRWGAKDKWAKAKRDEMIWKDVRVIDAVDIEAWVLQAQATHVWLSRLLNLVPVGADDLETVWADWAEGITPTATPELILAGRADDAGKVTSWLGASGRGALTVSAESADDAFGVIAAAVMMMPEAERTRILARTVVVSNTDAFVQLLGSTEPLILIPTYATGSEIQRATRAGHGVVLPVGPVPGAEPSATRVVMPRVRRRDAEAALVAMGVPSERARELAGVARRSMLTLRRRMATNLAREVPLWATPSVGPSLVPMLLLGQFDERKDADLQALGTLTTGGLTALRETLLRWSQEIDPPVRRAGDVWYLVSKEDAWSLLSRYITSENLKQFALVAKDVLGEVHPKFDLPPEERWVANMHGKERRYSSTVVAGVADTIALLGALGSSVTIQGGVSPSAIANRFVRDLFEAIAGDWRGWATLASALPLLAEGAPDEFLKAVDAQIASDEAAVRTLFKDEGDLLFSSSLHTGILWALEVLAWSPDHLAYSARLLAALDRLDPGGRITNRPANSLRAIFLGWIPQTSAVLDARLEILALLRVREPAAAWRLFANLLPRHHDHSTNNPRPQWRDWVQEGAGAGATYRDIYRQTSVLIGWMIEDAGNDAARWKTLVEALDDVGSQEFDAIVTALAGLLGQTSDDRIRAPLFDALRGLMSRHRSFSDATWALPEDRVRQLEPLYLAATPDDPVARLRWMFSNHPELPEGREEDWESHRTIVFARQQDAVRALHAALGTRGFIELADQVDRPDELGRILAIAEVLRPPEMEALLDELLRAGDWPTLAMGRGMANGWTFHMGEANALAVIRDKEGGWSDEARGRLLLSQTPSAATLDVVDGLNEDGRRAFWLGANGFWLEGETIERGLLALLAHGRSHAVVDAAAMHLQKHPKLDPELLAKALEHAPTQSTDSDGTQMTAYDIGVVLDALERAAQESRIDEVAVAKLEFLYLGILGHFERPPRVLHRSMANDPRLFVDAVRLAYRASGTEPATMGVDEVRLAERAHHLLDTWRESPGMTPAGLDAAAMNVWVNETRAALKAIGRQEIGDLLLGQVMSGAAADDDGAWPLIAIRDLMERITSEDFEQGLAIGRFNGRGVITRDPLAGGFLEKSEAEAYERMASATATRWLRTATMLRGMARNSRAHAEHEDTESELREDLES